MFENLYADLQKKLDAIATEGTCPPIPDWRETEIKNWSGGFVAEAARIAGPSWWQKPASAAESSLAELLRAKGYGPLKTGDGTTVEEVIASQHEKEKTKVEDEAAAEWREYLGDPKADARQWFADLGKKLDMNTTDAKGFFGALKDHVESKGNAKCADLNPQIVELCLRGLCSSRGSLTN